jgi:hypothetical protein
MVAAFIESVSHSSTAELMFEVVIFNLITLPEKIGVGIGEGFGDCVGPGVREGEKHDSVLPLDPKPGGHVWQLDPL